MQDYILSSIRLSDFREVILEAVRSVIESTPEIGNNSKELLSLPEAAEFLRLSRPTMYKLVHGKNIPFSKPRNGKLLFHRAELIKWIESSHRVTKRQSKQEIHYGLTHQ